MNLSANIPKCEVCKKEGKNTPSAILNGNKKTVCAFHWLKEKKSKK